MWMMRVRRGFKALLCFVVIEGVLWWGGCLIYRLRGGNINIFSQDGQAQLEDHVLDVIFAGN